MERRTGSEFQDDQVGVVASGVAFRVAIAFFPDIALLVWIGTRLIGAQEARALIASISDAVPDSSRAVIGKAVPLGLHLLTKTAKLRSDRLSRGAPR